MTFLIIGNLISLAAAVFTAKSSWARDTWHIYFYQVMQCSLQALASVFFNSYAGIITLLVCAFRNYMAATGRLTRRLTLICLFIVLILGVALNNRGAVGLVVIAASVIYTLGTYLAKSELAIKCNIVLNSFLWVVYGVLILDIPSTIADFIGLVVALASIVRIFLDKRTHIKEK